MSFLDRAKDALDPSDDAGERDEGSVEVPVVPASESAAGDATRHEVLPDTAPGVSDGGPAEEQLFEPEGTPGAGDGTVRE